MSNIINEIQLLNLIYKGTRSSVYLGQLENKKVAVKIIPKQYFHQIELHIPKNIQHENILKVEKSFSDDNRIIIASEFCSGGDLANYISRHSLIEENFAIKVTYQLVSALSFLHQKKIAHLDVKPDNILLTETTAKLCDFELSRIVGNRKEAIRSGTEMYSPPEHFLQEQSDLMKADIWGVGCVLYSLLTASYPWDEVDIPSQVLSSEPKIIKFLQLKLQIILRKLFAKDPHKRPTAEETKALLDEFYFSVYGEHLIHE